MFDRRADGGDHTRRDWGRSETMIQAADLEAFRESARRASTLLKSMGNAHRLMILCQLVEGEKCVSELERLVGLSQSALSQHLARLRRDNLVTTRRSAQTIFYSLVGLEARSVIATLYDLYCANPKPATYSLPIEDRAEAG
jgi:ArsR family transcriptional regulator, virulence genes transcriptional regulator